MNFDYLFLENFSYLKNFSLKSQQELLLFQIAFFQNYTISNDLISVKYLKLIKRINIQNSIIKLQTMISLKNNFIYFFKNYNRNLKQINQVQFLKRPTFIGTKQINNIFFYLFVNKILLKNFIIIGLYKIPWIWNFRYILKNIHLDLTIEIRVKFYWESDYTIYS